MSRKNKGRELVGKQVTVTNPNMGTQWAGQAIAFTERPTLMVELAGGFRIMLPSDWAIEQPNA